MGLRRDATGSGSLNGSYLTDGAPAGVVLDAVQLLNQPLVDLRWEGTGAEVGGERRMCPSSPRRR